MRVFLHDTAGKDCQIDDGSQPGVKLTKKEDATLKHGTARHSRGIRATIPPVAGTAFETISPTAVNQNTLFINPPHCSQGAVYRSTRTLPTARLQSFIESLCGNSQADHRVRLGVR